MLGSHGFTASSLHDQPLLDDIYSQIDQDARHIGDDEMAVYVQLFQTLSRSDIAHTMLKEACMDDWSVSLDDLDAQDYQINLLDQHITLNSTGLSARSLRSAHYFQCSMTMALTRALRDIWHERRVAPFDERFAPDHILHMERISAADRETIAVRIAWDVEQSGNPALWRHMIASDEGDIAMTFANSLDHSCPDDTHIYDAMNAAFTQWFSCEQRLNMSDHDCLEYLDMLLEEEGSSAFYTDKPSTEDVEILSCLPNRVAYLQGRGGDLLRNPLYVGLNDTVNQAHFMQIMHDVQSVQIGGIAFRDADLASKIFPDLGGLSLLKARA